MVSNETGSETIDTIDTLIAILGKLKETDGAGVTSLANRSDLTKSTVHRHLATLQAHGYVKNEDGHYKLTYKFLELGGAVRGRDKFLVEIKPKVRQLASNTGEHAQYFVEEQMGIVSVFQSRGDQAIKTDTHVGKRLDLYHTAAGKAILSTKNPEELEAYIEQENFEERTDNTITDPNELRRELQQIRDQGYSINSEEGVNGVKAVGVTVRTRSGRTIGAISVVGPRSRFTQERIEGDIVPMMLGIQNELEINLEYL